MSSIARSLGSDPTKFIYNAGFEAVKEFTNDAKVFRTTIRPRLVVKPFLPPFIPLEVLSQDVGGMIESWSWNKGRSTAGGQLQVTVSGDDAAVENMMNRIPGGGAFLKKIWGKFGSSVRDLFQPGALVQFWLNDYHVCTGTIRGVKKSTTPEERSYDLTIDELGNKLNEAMLSYEFIRFCEGQNIANSKDGKIWKFGGTLAGANLFTAVFMYLQFYLLTTLSLGTTGWPMPWVSGSDGVPIAYRFIAQPAPFGCLSPLSWNSNVVVDTHMVLNGGVSFYDFLKGLMNENFMEFWTETGGRTVCVGRNTNATVGSSFLTSGALTATTNAGGSISVGGAAAGLPIPQVGLAVTLPGFCYPIVRSIPYQNPMLGFGFWDGPTYPYALGVHDLLLAGDFVIITDRDILSSQIEQSDYQQKTAFQVDFTNKNSSGDASKSINRPSYVRGPLLPIFHGGARTFGNKLMQTAVSVNGFQAAGLTSQVIERYAARMGLPGFSFGSNVLSTILNNYHRNQHRFMEGTFTTRVIPYARPGMLLFYLPDLTTGKIDDVRAAGMYYIENTASGGSASEGATTTFTVIRGVPFPFAIENILDFLFNWELQPPGPNLWDGEPG